MAIRRAAPIAVLDNCCSDVRPAWLQKSDRNSEVWLPLIFAFVFFKDGPCKETPKQHGLVFS